MYTYYNTFHNTEFKTRKSEEELFMLEYSISCRAKEDTPEADRAFARRMRRTLCPSHSSGCTCGDFFGRRNK